MKIETVTKITFSPTGTTKKIVNSITKGMKLSSVQNVNLNDAEVRNTQLKKIKGDIVLIGVPVYEETIPEILREFFASLECQGKPAVILAVYGNIESGITLHELNKYCTKSGMKVAGGATFIGEHSFTNKKINVARKRPDDRDLEIAISFGKDIKNKLNRITKLQDIPDFNFPGNLPFIAKILPANSVRYIASTEFNENKCNHCGICEQLCPMNIIDENTHRVMDNSKCIRCFACVKNCPQNARKMTFINDFIVKRFLTKKGSQRKEPKLYL